MELDYPSHLHETYICKRCGGAASCHGQRYSHCKAITAIARYISSSYLSIKSRLLSTTLLASMGGREKVGASCQPSDISSSVNIGTFFAASRCVCVSQTSRIWYLDSQKHCRRYDPQVTLLAAGFLEGLVSCLMLQRPPPIAAASLCWMLLSSTFISSVHHDSSEQQLVNLFLSPYCEGI